MNNALNAYLAKSRWKRVRIYFQVLFVFYKSRFIRWINRLYRKFWPFIFALVMLPYVSVAAYMMYKDYSYIHNYANLDFANSDFYTKWRTDGNPGQDPPKN